MYTSLLFSIVSFCFTVKFFSSIISSLPTCLWLNEAKFQFINHCFTAAHFCLPAVLCLCFPQGPEVRGTHYVCVDSVESSQLLISFSALLLWGDTPGDSKNIKPYTAVHVHSHTCTTIALITRFSAKEGFFLYSACQPLQTSKYEFPYVCAIYPPFLNSQHILEMGMSHAARGSAVLIALPYTWKSLQLQLPLLTIKTTCSKAAMLDLPPG